MGLETTTRVPVNHLLNDTNAHYVFYCDFVGASELRPAAVAGCFLAKAHHPHATKTNVCCAATRSRLISSTKLICVLAITFLTLYYTIEFNKSNIECSVLFIQYTLPTSQEVKVREVPLIRPRKSQ